MLPGLEAAELPADAIEVGRVLDAWGIKGWIRVLPYSADPEALFSSKRWYLMPSEKGAKTFEGGALLRIKEAKTHTDSVVACAHEIDDRNAAECLRGARIFIARSSFPSVQPDEYYWVDLIGLTVINRQGECLGQVRELLSTGPQTVLVLEDVSTEPHVERMIPFVGAFVDSVQLSNKKILVDWHQDY
jgi:16S rRNA processing protein RimM